METRDIMDVDVLFVGGGIASLSGALHLSNLIKKHNEKVEKDGTGKKIDEIMIAVLEKSPYIGSHSISGAAMNPVALKELIPDYLEKGAPLEGEVKNEEVLLLTKTGRIKAPIIPKPMDNHGNYIVSLAKLVEWLGQRVEEQGINIFPGFPGTEILYEGEKVIGVRTGDKGIDVNGSKKSNYEPGIDLHAKITVFGDGSRGNLTKSLIQKFKLDVGKNPQAYEVGVKEVWELPEARIEPGYVIHTMGYPHKNDTFGGAFIYGMKENRITLGLLTSLDYPDPFLDPHREFQRYKTHPYIAELLKGGKMVQYGAKSVPVGGFFSVPKPIFEGGLLIGDAAALFNGMRIKGIHYAMKSGMLAAETILDCLIKGDFSLNQLENYRSALANSYIYQDLYKVRNFHQAFHKGFWFGLVKVGLQLILGGRILKSRLESKPDFMHMKKVVEYYGSNSTGDQHKAEMKFDGERTFDKMTDVYYSGTTHEEKQPPHLKVLDLNICYNRCKAEYQNPCEKFCPAGVYEIITDEKTGKPELKVNFSNCVHCKTCDIKDPYENINWVPPEGGGGPKYTLV